MFSLLHLDDRLAAIDKPSGWLVHRSNLDRHETRIVVQALRDQIGRRVYPAHRLDKGTSGVLLCALDALATQRLAGQFERQEVHKTYLAVVRGWPPAAGRIDHPLSRAPDDWEEARRADSATAQAAVTDYCRLASAEFPVAVDRYPTARYALVRLEPHTGRRHQLRRHMKHIAHPIIGDATHGKGRHNRFFAERFGCRRLLLHCASLNFLHPEDDRWMTLRAPLDASFESVIRAPEWQWASGLGADLLAPGISAFCHAPPACSAPNAT